MQYVCVHGPDVTYCMPLRLCVCLTPFGSLQRGARLYADLPFRALCLTVDPFAESGVSIAGRTMMPTDGMLRLGAVPTVTMLIGWRSKWIWQMRRSRSYGYEITSTTSTPQAVALSHCAIDQISADYATYGQ